MKSRSPRLRGSCSALAAFLLLGCGENEPETPAAAPLPAFVRIAVVDALVGPGKSDGQAWDGVGSIPTGALESLGSALSRIDPRAAFAAAGAVLVDVGASAIEPPEPEGWVDLFVAGQPQGRHKLGRKGQRDTFTPLWEGPPAWSRVPLNPGVRLTGELQDRDMLTFADPMGHFQIGYDEIVAALRAGRVYPVKVSDQTYRQVLFVGIEVMPVP
jgi:hypothetical protein